MFPTIFFVTRAIFKQDGFFYSSKMNVSSHNSVRNQWGDQWTTDWWPESLTLDLPHHHTLTLTRHLYLSLCLTEPLSSVGAQSGKASKTKRILSPQAQGFIRILNEILEESLSIILNPISTVVYKNLERNIIRTFSIIFNPRSTGI